MAIPARSLRRWTSPPAGTRARSGTTEQRSGGFTHEARSDESVPADIPRFQNGPVERHHADELYIAEKRFAKAVEQVLHRRIDLAKADGDHACVDENLSNVEDDFANVVEELDNVVEELGNVIDELDNVVEELDNLVDKLGICIDMLDKNVEKLDVDIDELDIHIDELADVMDAFCRGWNPDGIESGWNPDGIRVTSPYRTPIGAKRSQTDCRPVQRRLDLKCG
jgi:archaellum component FlaC